MYIRSQNRETIIKIDDINQISQKESDGVYNVLVNVGNEIANIGMYSSDQKCNEVMDKISYILESKNKPKLFRLFISEVYNLPDDNSYWFLEYFDADII